MVGANPLSFALIDYCFAVAALIQVSMASDMLKSTAFRGSGWQLRYSSASHELTLQNSLGCRLS